MKIRCLSILLISILAFTMPSCHVIDALDGDKDKDEDTENIDNDETDYGPQELETDLSSITLEASGKSERYVGSTIFAKLSGNTSKDFPPYIHVYIAAAGVGDQTMTIYNRSTTHVMYKWHAAKRLSGRRYTVRATVSGKTFRYEGTL